MNRYPLTHVAKKMINLLFILHLRRAESTRRRGVGKVFHLPGERLNNSFGVFDVYRLGNFASSLVVEDIKEKINGLHNLASRVFRHVVFGFVAERRTSLLRVYCFQNTVVSLRAVIS